MQATVTDSDIAPATTPEADDDDDDGVTGGYTGRKTQLEPRCSQPTTPESARFRCCFGLGNTIPAGIVVGWLARIIRL